jgi:peroxiredoxin
MIHKMKLFNRALVFSLLSLFLSLTSFGQKGYEIKVKLSNYSQEKLILGFQLGDKSYIKDSAMVDKNGWFTFENKETSLDPGVYIVLMKPDNQYFQILIDDNDQHFSFEADGKEPLKTLKTKGSNQNNQFYEYLRFLDKKRVDAEGLKKLTGPENSESVKKKAEDELEKINKDVRKYQDELCLKNQNTLMAALIKGSQDIEVPEFKNLPDSLNKIARYYYFKNHYFDNIELTNKKLLKTNVLFQKVDYYVQKLCVQHPDTISAGVNRILNLMHPNEDIFKFYLIHFLNYYAKSNIVGFDAVYVNIVENFYAKGLAPWTEKDQLDKIMKEARQLKPILIGKQAPNIKMFKEDGSTISLYDVQSDFVILLFWNPDCGHCKKEMPQVVSMEKKYKDRGVKIFSVCTALRDKVSTCWDFVKEKEMQDFLNVVDPDVSSGYYSMYKVQQTPMTFILDRNKKIISKRISPEQLEEVMDHFVTEKEREMK